MQYIYNFPKDYNKIKIKTPIYGTVLFWMSQNFNYVKYCDIIYININYHYYCYIIYACVLKANLLRDFLKFNCRILDVAETVSSQIPVK